MAEPVQVQRRRANLLGPSFQLSEFWAGRFFEAGAVPPAKNAKGPIFWREASQFAHPRGGRAYFNYTISLPSPEFSISAYQVLTALATLTADVL
jgi:hypothetical protein